MQKSLDYNLQNTNIQKTIKEEIQEQFPIIGKQKTLRLDHLYFEDKLESDDIPLQKNYKLKKRDWTVPLYGRFSLIDNASGRILDSKKKIKIANIPKITNRFSVIYGGNEYQTINQLRLKPGIYTRIKNNGELESRFNLKKGFNFTMTFDPKIGVFYLNLANKKYFLYNVLTLLEITDSEIEKKWGNDLVEKNKMRALPKEGADIIGLYEKLFKLTPTTESQARRYLRKYFDDTRVSEETTKVTLGKSYKKIDGTTLLDTSNKLLKVFKKEEEPDERDSLAFKELYSIDDLLHVNFAAKKKLLVAPLKFRVDNKDNIREIISSKKYSDTLRKFFTEGELSVTPGQRNPLDIVSEWRKTTVMGAGGITNEHEITAGVRNIHPSHLSFLDPIETPECVVSGYELLTYSGWKYIEDITEKDKLACCINEKLEFHNPTKVVSYDYNGEVFGFKAQKISQLVTPEHRVWCRPLVETSVGFRFEEAKDFYGKDRIVSLGCDPYKGSTQRLIELPGTNEKIPIADWCELIGWFVTEGCTSNYNTIYIAQTTKINVEYLKKFLATLPIKKWSYSNRTFRIVGNKILHDYLESLGKKAKNKILPEELLHVSIKARKRLLNALMLGDGRRTDPRYANKSKWIDRDIFTTSSYKLANQVERLMISLGYAVSHKVYKDKREDRYLDIHEVRILYYRHIQVRKEHHFKEHYKGKVYCATVPGGLLLVKKDNCSPYWTGNSLRIGVTLGLAIDAEKHGQKIETTVIEPNGKKRFVTPAEMWDMRIGFPDQFNIVGGAPKAKNPMVKVMFKGKQELASASKVNAYIPFPMSLLGYSSNMIPFLQHNSGNRAMTGARQLSQAVSLVKNEPPRVRAKLTNKKTFEDAIGSYLNPIVNENNKGTVTKITKDYVYIKRDIDGKIHKVGLFNNFPLNGETFLNSIPRVKVGEKVEPKTLLADSNFSKDGVLTLGKNVNFAYMPWHGYNFEDAIVVTENFAKNMTSRHMIKKNLLVSSKEGLLSLKKFQAYYPGIITPENASKLDENGIIKIGSEILPEEILVSYLEKAEETDAEKLLKHMNKAMASPYRNRSLIWDEGHKGTVTYVNKVGNNITIHIKVVKEFVVGDKLCGDSLTQVLTKNGWKYYDEINLTDKICTLNPKTHTIEYQEPEAINIYEHNGPMYHIANSSIDQMVTLNHKMYVKLRGRPNYELLPAKDIIGKKAHYLNTYTLSDVCVGNSEQQVEEIVDYKGIVWCPTTKNGIVYIRRNGKTCWTGNSNRHGAKGIVSKIIPDDEAPHDLKGNRYDVLYNPAGVAARMNIGQLLETAAGELAGKTGKPYIVQNFNDVDNTKKLLKELKDAGINPNKIMLDGKNGKRFKNTIFAGNQYVTKLEHTIDHKLRTRSINEGYDINEQPITRKHKGQSIDPMLMYSLLSHGSKQLLWESTAVKGQKNEEYWRNLMMGLSVPKPTKSFAFQKMSAYLQAAGVNIQKEGDKLQLLPLTDAEVTKISRGEITDPGTMLRGKDLGARKGGLFDPKILGGMDGQNWGHINLAISIPNPMYRNAIARVLDITPKKFDELLEAGEDIGKMLEKVDVKKELVASKEAIAKAPESKVNILNKKIRYLKALDRFGLKPTDYMIKKVPVLPPKFRPIYPLPSGDLVPSPINEHYKNLGLINNSIKDTRKLGLEDSKDQFEIYTAVKNLQGISEPIGFGKRKYEGLIHTLAGDVPKFGFIQNKVWSKRQDLTGRSTIVIEPSFGIDQIGLPDDISKSIYKPFVVQTLVRTGFSPVEALKHVKEWSPQAEQALDIEMKRRPVLMNRAPSLHKHSIQAFWPLRTQNKSIDVNPLILKGIAGDADGDCLQDYVILYIDSKELVSQSKLTVDSDNVLEYVTSTYKHLSKKGLEMIKNMLVNYTKDSEGKYYNIHIKDFPHITTSKVSKSSTVDEYDVPEFIKAIALENGEFKLKQVTKWSVHRNLKMVKVKTTSRETEVSVDHSLICFNSDTGEIEKMTPEKALSNLTPIPKKFNLKSKKKKYTKDFDDGYFDGFMTGDGWSAARGTKSFPTSKNRVHISTTSDNVIKKISKYIGKEGYTISSPHKFKGHDCFSKKTTWSNKFYLAEYIRDEIGCGAINKHIPRDFLNQPDEYKHGLLSGLLDSDGTITTNNTKFKNKTQYLAGYTTISKELCHQIQFLLASLGIKSGVSTYIRNNKDVYNINVSMIDLIKIRINLKLQVKKKAKLLKEAVVYYTDRKDIIPIPKKLAIDISEKHIKCTMYPSLYTTLRKATKMGTLSRYSANKVCSIIGAKQWPEYTKWKNEIVNNKNICWEKITSITPSTETTGYDLTVPGPYVFMTSNLLTVQDTVSIHVPVSTKAVEEAKNILPSKIPFKHGDNALVPEISQEYILGLYYLTKIERPTNKRYTTIEQAKKDKTLLVNDGIYINGKQTSLGRIRFNGVLPKQFRAYDVQITKKKLNGILTKIAKESPDDFAQVISSLKDLGNQTSHSWGATVSLGDFDLDRSFRNKTYAEADKKAKGKSEDEQAKIYIGATKKIEKNLHTSQTGKNRAYDLLISGAKGNPDQYRQIMGTVGNRLDVKGNIITQPIRQSFAEGLDSSSYWSDLYGARAGAVDRAVNTRDSGALNKVLLSTTRTLLVTVDNCGTKKGIEISVDDSNVLDRALAKAYPGVGRRNEITDPELIAKAKIKKERSLLVRSPLTCEAIEGVCKYCYGLLPNGQLPNIGDNVGVADGQGMLERSLQLTMSSFHSGSSALAQSAVTAGFPRLNQLLELPRILANKAVLADIDGQVTNIEPHFSGGINVYINKEPHYIQPGIQIKVKLGDKVKKGDVLSAGPIDPKELAGKKNFLTAQRYIVNELDNVYDGQLHKKTFETVVRSVTDNAKVLQNNEELGLVRGDKMSLSRIKALNKEQKSMGLPGIKYEPYFKPISHLSSDKEDWLGRLTSRRLKQTITEGSATGMASNLHGKDPIPGYLYGEEFGQRKDKFY